MALQFASPCIRCGKPYLEGSRTTCQDCLRARRSRGNRRTRPQHKRAAPMRCDCGELAQVVALVWVGDPETGLTRMRLPLCPACLAEEQRTQELLAELGLGHPGRGLNREAGPQAEPG